MQAAHSMQDGDAVALFNFRSDRMVEISKAFEYQDFNAFDRKRFPKVAACCCAMMLNPILTESEASTARQHVSLDDRDETVGTCQCIWALAHCTSCSQLSRAGLCLMRRSSEW